MKKILKNIFILLAILGLIISSYLTYAHYNINIETTKDFCSVGGTLNFLEQGDKSNSCASVLESEYSQFYGIPTSLFGIIFYISVLVLVAFIFKKDNIKLNKILSLLLFIGLLESIYFTYLQFFVIDGFCIYCFSSAVIILFLFLLNLFID